MINNDFSFFDLSSGPILNILSNLSVRELFVFSQVSKECKKYADETLRTILITCNQNESALEKVIEKWKTFFISAIDDSDNFGKICMFKVCFSKDRNFVFKVIRDKPENFDKTWILKDQNAQFESQKYISDDHEKPVLGSLKNYIFKNKGVELLDNHGCNHWTIQKNDKEKIHCIAYLEGSRCTMLMPGQIAIAPALKGEILNQSCIIQIEERLIRNFGERVRSPN